MFLFYDYWYNTFRTGTGRLLLSMEGSFRFFSTYCITGYSISRFFSDYSSASAASVVGVVSSSPTAATTAGTSRTAIIVAGNISFDKNSVGVCDSDISDSVQKSGV